MQLMRGARHLAGSAEFIRRLGTRLRRDASGLALIEFALAAPLVVATGLYGIELANLALVNMRISQYTMDLADNAARMGDEAGLTTYTIDEANINDAMQGIRLEGNSLHLTTYGRITLSSLEGTGGKQLLHWQRCIGQMKAADYQSTYGTASGTSGTYIDNSGMGDTNYKVIAPDGSAVMFVEINYLYQPLFGKFFLTPRKLHYVSSYIVRDDARSYSSGVTNTNSQTTSSCSAYLA